MTDDRISRRKLLVAVAGGGALLHLSSDDTVTGGGAGGFETISDQRGATIRPVAGGTAVADSDSAATLGGGVETTDGERRWLTARHPVDPEFCGGSDDDVLGVAVYQPPMEADDNEIGTVAAVGQDAGHDATDWAAVQPASDNEWTSYILGLGNPQGTTEPAVGDRIVMSGARTGLIGGEIIGTSAAKVFRGCQFFGLIQYSVDGNADTNGNSGALVGAIDSNGDLQLVGVHIFGDEDGRYALPIGDVLQDADLQVSIAGDKPADSLAPGVLEAAAVSHDSDQDTIDVLVANPGGEHREGWVRVVNGETTIASADVALSSFSRTTETLSTAGHGTIIVETGDVSRQVTLQ